MAWRQSDFMWPFLPQYQQTRPFFASSPFWPLLFPFYRSTVFDPCQTEPLDVVVRRSRYDPTLSQGKLD